LDGFHINTDRSQSKWVLVLLRIIQIHSKDLLPSIPVRDVKESVSVIDPMHLVQDINPGVISILKDYTRSSWSVWIDTPNGHMILKAINLLDQDSPRGLVIVHVSQVAVVIAVVSFSITRDWHPSGSGGTIS
jgi:hypothetical protein